MLSPGTLAGAGGPGGTRGSVSSTASDDTLELKALPERKASAGMTKKMPAAKSNSKKRDLKHVKRPPNAFMLFRSWFLKSDKMPQIRQMSQASQILGAVWHNLPAPERRQWHALAIERQREHLSLQFQYKSQHDELVSGTFEGRFTQPAASPVPSGSLSLASQPCDALKARTLLCATAILSEWGHDEAAFERVKQARSDTRRMRRARLENDEEGIARLERLQRNRIARKQSKLYSCDHEDAKHSAYQSAGSANATIPVVSSHLQCNGLGFDADISRSFDALMPTSMPTSQQPAALPQGSAAKQLSIYQPPVAPSMSADPCFLTEPAGPLDALSMATMLRSEPRPPSTAPLPTVGASGPTPSPSHTPETVFEDMMRDCSVTLSLLPNESSSFLNELDTNNDFGIPLTASGLTSTFEAACMDSAASGTPQTSSSDHFHSAGWELYGQNVHNLTLPRTETSDLNPQAIDLMAWTLLAPDPHPTEAQGLVHFH